MTILAFNRDRVDEDLRGIWKLEWIQSNGSPKRRERQLWVFRHGILTIVGDDSIDHATITVDPAASPKQIDTDQAVLSTGVYAIDGDELQVSFVALDLPRPTEFQTVQGDFRTLAVFRRVVGHPQTDVRYLRGLLASEFGSRNTYPDRREFDDAAEEFIGELARRIYDKHRERTKNEQVVHQIDWMITEISNGGFHQFFYNSIGNDAVETAALLREIAAPETAALIEAGCALFPNKTPSKNLEERRAQLERFSLDQLEVLRDLEERFFSRTEDVNLLLRRYWENTP